MQTRAASWADFAATVWNSDPTARWVLYVVIVLAAAVLVWRTVRTIRTAIGEMREDLGIVKHEVKNNHDTNLREEADVRHDENKGTLTAIERKVDAILERLGQHDWRLGELEHTQDRRPDAHTLDKG
ncbi:DUF2746 domain-containing protein [Curtobacterium sp. MCBD17_032]|uniref:DUF2746 domain-containing protein n=1 Tax=Curtobacterium sp. MCBD17_032 TaxID=2175659 RepID=UPI000DA7EFE0|nr:DUF2746 domain-containing protein [Curtobacterium sp. MCBD17_032]PZE84152.1 hypothetical protein DEI91_09665 [Curtobacterium sp. MCBD17_032]